MQALATCENHVTKDHIVKQKGKQPRKTVVLKGKMAIAQMWSTFDAQKEHATMAELSVFKNFMWMLSETQQTIVQQLITKHIRAFKIPRLSLEAIKDKDENTGKIVACNVSGDVGSPKTVEVHRVRQLLCLCHSVWVKQIIIRSRKKKRKIRRMKMRTSYWACSELHQSS